MTSHTRITLNGATLGWPAIRAVLVGPVQVTLNATAKRRVRAAHAVVARKASGSEAVYGINTGFGIFARTKIAPDKLRELQRNIVVSHAAGVGPLLPDPLVRLMLLLKIHGLALGHSGVRVELIEQMAAWLAADCLPEIPGQGSVGASGDLAPLAHLVLPMIGEGYVRCGGKRLSAAQAIKQFTLPRIVLEPKEGLAVLNGTQAMLALCCAAVLDAERALLHADLAGALTIEGMFGSVRPFDARLHQVRPHPGAQGVAKRLLALTAGSKVIASHAGCARVQDPYALRCMPAVHGAAWDALAWVRQIAERELQSVTDNPIVFPSDDEIISGGNFHGAPLALAMDTLAVALATCSSISERRIEQLINPKANELPSLGLTAEPGLHSGFMVAHTTAASLVSENKTLAHPASVDTIPTWAGQEDHVSMGMWGARKLHMILQNTEQVIAIELLAACQAVDLHPTRHALGRGTARAYTTIRAQVPAMPVDRYIAPDLAAALALLRSGGLV